MTTDWDDTVDIVLDRLRDFFAPEDFPFDFSPGSLESLEALLLDRYAPESPPVPAGDDFIESLLAYAGEVALRMTGGTWQVRDGVPYVVPAPVLGLDPIELLPLLIAAARARTGKVLTAAAERWADAVAAHPEFSPPPVIEARVPTGGDRLATWLATRAKAFPRWLDDYAGGDRGYDFSPASLELLQEMLRRRLPAGDADVDRPANAELVNGAAWYFGEVITRTKPAAAWVSPGPDEPDPDEHFLYNADRDASTRPFMAVRLTTDPDDLVPMRRMYDIFR